MSQPKRVRDSKKRTVRQGKEQVWLVDGEKVVNTNHGFAEATGTDVVYDSSWESPQEPLQVYDNGREEVGGETTSATIIGISQQYLEIVNGESTGVEVYFSPDDADIDNISATSTNPEIVGVVNVGQDPGVLYFSISAASDSGYSTVTFSDGTNSYNCEVACTPFIHVESIGAPSRNEIYVSPGNDQSFFFNYSPERASNPPIDIAIESQNANYGFTTNNGVFRVETYYRGEDVDGTISYYLTTAPETVYNVTVHNVTPTIRVESLSGIPSEVAHLAPESNRTFQITYLPEDADEIESQIVIRYDDPSVVSVWIRNVDPSTHTFLIDYHGNAEGFSNVYFFLNGNMVAQTGVTIEYPPISALSNLQYTNPTADGGEVYSRMSAGATFEYTPTRGAGGLTITQTGGTRVDGTSWDTPDGQDISLSIEEISYNNGTATIDFYVDNEASVGQRGSWRIAVENDPSEYLDVKITYANEPAPSTDCTITVEANDNTMGSVDIPSVTVPFDTSISYNGNQVTIGSTTVTATANTGYQQRGWMNMIFTAIEDTTIMAEFEPQSRTVTFTPNDATYGSVSPASVTADYGTSITFSNDYNNIIYIGDTAVTATAETGYEFINYQLSGGDPLPATLTDNLNIEAVFGVYSPGE